MPVWLENHVDEKVAARLEGAGFGRIVARCLAARGVTPETVDDFLSPSLRGLAPPECLPGVEDAARTVLRAVRERRRIVIFGDYDCDGICATAILLKSLCILGADVAAFIPDRLSEGYGMTAASVARMLSANPGVSLVVTVDNGIGSADLVAELEGKGISVVVTDHHLPGEVIPRCTVVNPKLEGTPPELSDLCGAGVAFMLANAVVSQARAMGLYNGSNVAGPLVVLAGLATVTDIMPLTGQNRILVFEGLRLFSKYAPYGLSELLNRASKTASDNIQARDFGFALGPRLNAAGRMASAMEALRLVMATDREQARQLAVQVDMLNGERRSVELKMTEEASARLVPGAPVQIIDLDEGHQGVAGIVAARILERIRSEGAAVPVCVAVCGHGSARAPEGYNIRDALAAASDALTSFGGHAAAGGYTVAEGRGELFRELLARACAAQAKTHPDCSEGVLRFDTWVDPSEITMDLVKSLSRLEPFGEGNPEPVFAVKGVVFSDIRPIGENGRHVRLSSKSCPDAIWWHRGNKVEELRAAAHSPFDIMFAPFVSTYGEDHVELRVCGLRKSVD